MEGIRRMDNNDLNLLDETCPDCGGPAVWVECYKCEDGFIGHECGEDSCCCLNPEYNVRCDICGGDQGWTACYNDLMKEREKYKHA